jgi:hypothetical protein
MDISKYKLMAFDKVHEDIKEVCQVNSIEGNCLLWLVRNETRVTVCREFKDVIFLNCSGLKDVNGKEILEGHMIESSLSSDKMMIKYGEYSAYCPADRQYMNSVGFYASADNLPDMPLGPTEEYAKIVGHVLIHPGS